MAIKKIKETEQVVPKIDLKKMVEMVRALENNEELFTERIAELEFALEDADWLKLSMESEKEFSRQGIDNINQLARLSWLKNPLIRRAVLTQANYVFGQGINLNSDNEQVDAVIQKFLDDPKNKVELTDHAQLMIKEQELQLFSNIFFVFFTDRKTGRVRVRTIPVDEVRQIITDPDDNKTPLYYKRVYVPQEFDPRTGETRPGTEKIIYYRDWKNTKQTIVFGKDQKTDASVYHVKVNALTDMKFGVSEVYSALDWSSAHKGFLEDWTTIVKAYARFAWRLTSKTRAGQAAAKQKLSTTLDSTSGKEDNPTPSAGSILAEVEGGVKMDPIKTAGATTAADDGDKLIHMVSAATGIFYHYLVGDPSTGNLATAKAMEYPMQLQFKNRQGLWETVLKNILEFVTLQSVKAPVGIMKGTIERDEYGEEIIKLEGDEEMSMNISFPDILEKDLTERIDAIIKAATLDGKTPKYIEKETLLRMLLETLGYTDVDEMIEEMWPDGLPEDEPEPEPLQNNTVLNQPIEKVVTESFAVLKEAIKKIENASTNSK
jgi:hypothetical protein